MQRWCVFLLLWCGVAFAAGDGSGPLHHIVLVSFHEQATADQRQQVIDDTYRLIAEVPGVVHVAAGPKARADRPVHIGNYDVGIYVRLQDEAALSAYATHPKHLQLLKNHKPVIANIQVIDFTSPR